LALITTRSASFPGVTEPIWSSRPSIRAPSVVIQRSASRAGIVVIAGMVPLSLARLRIVERPLHRQRDAGGGEEIAGQHGFQIDADRSAAHRA
jgi:hypothetical protein